MSNADGSIARTASWRSARHIGPSMDCGGLCCWLTDTRTIPTSGWYDPRFHAIIAASQGLAKRWCHAATDESDRIARDPPVGVAHVGEPPAHELPADPQRHRPAIPVGARAPADQPGPESVRARP